MRFKRICQRTVESLQFRLREAFRNLGGDVNIELWLVEEAKGKIPLIKIYELGNYAMMVGVPPRMIPRLIYLSLRCVDDYGYKGARFYLKSPYFENLYVNALSEMIRGISRESRLILDNLGLPFESEKLIRLKGKYTGGA